MQSRNMFIIAPQTKISSNQKESLKKYLLSGNNIVIAAGWEHYQNIKDFVNEYGIALENCALGPVPYNNESINQIDYNRPEFKEAYPIIIDNTNTKVLQMFREYNVVTSTKVKGGGKIIYIADSRFLCGNNIEGETDGKIYNISFLKKILGEEL